MDASTTGVPNQGARRPEARPIDWVWSVGAVAVATALAEAAQSLLALPDVVMLYLAAILLVGVRSGRGPTLLASLLSVAAYDFFFIPPFFSFAIADARHALTFAMMFGEGLMVSGLTERLRQREGAAQASELKARIEAHRSALLSSVSHDLRTPLATITGIASDLQERFDAIPGPERAELLAGIVEEAERLERLVGNLLEMTRLQAGVAPRREWVPVEELIGGVLTRLERRLGERAVTVRCEEGTPLVHVDPVLVEQALINLVENADRYAPPGTPIEIEAARRGPAVEIAVSDRGPGIDPLLAPRLFEKFSTGAASERGVGLGLAIVRAIVETHGGRVEALAREGGGTRFVTTWPISGEPPKVIAPDEEAPR
jgi:two-component system sensor histidine kinase KdpD